MNVLTDFIKTELYPRLFDRIREAFPEMEFKRRRDGWGSPRHLNGDYGQDKKQEQCFIFRGNPGYIKEWGTGRFCSLIDFEIMSRGGNPNDKDALIEAVKRLSDLCGLTVPTFEESEQWREYKAKQDRLETMAARMQAALYSPEGAATLGYLRNIRHYSDDVILRMGLGHIGPNERNELEGIIGRQPDGTGEAFTLAIPYHSGNAIRGFKFRAIDPTRKDKYRNSTGLPKSALLFGLSGLSLSGDKNRDRDITIVEGELDALRASCEGVPNICAAAGGDINPDAIAQAEKMGVKRITLLFDADEAGRKKTPEALKAIAAAGLNGYVATLPEGPNGGKMDVDEYLNTHTAEDLEGVIKNAKRGAMYLYDSIVERYSQKQEDGILLDKDFDDMAGEIVELMNSPISSQEDRDRIADNIETVFNGAITAETIRAKADAILADRERITQTQETIKTAEKALELAKAGKVGESIDTMKDEAERLKKITDLSEFSDLLRIPTDEEILRQMSDAPEGIHTGYYFGDTKKGPGQTREQMEEMIIPSGQISLIAGGTSHGKSKFLQNLALNLAQDGKDGDILYFTYEEDAGAVMRQFTNLYANLPLSRNNLRSIASYFRGGRDCRYFDDHADKDGFRKKEEEFRRDFLNTGKLRIFYRSDYSQDLVRAVRFLNDKLTLRAVFIDYAQMLYRDKNTAARNQELKEISDEIKNMAVKLKIPVIMAAQLSREAGTPDAMTAQTIADSADLERYANVVLCIWNGAATPNKKQDITAWGDCDLQRTLSSEYSLTLGAGGRGKIYAKLCKNRGATLNIDTVLDFNGNTGKISQTFPEAPTTQARTYSAAFGSNSIDK